ERKKVQDLLGSVQHVRGISTPNGEAEALVLEARLIARYEPAYNAYGKRWRRYAYLKLDPTEAWPRLKVVRTASANDGSSYLGPFGSSARARQAKDAIEDVFRIRRCTRSMGVQTRFAPCALSDMGRCLAPCDGRTTRERLELIEGALARGGEPPPEPIGSPVPRERADELAAIRSWITRHPTRVERCEVAPSEPVDGGAALARILGAMRDLGRTPGGRA